jgi:cell division protein FtsN
VSNSRQKFPARDYKHGGRRGGKFDITQYQQFGVGLGLGLSIALFVWLHGQRALPVEPEATAAPAPAAEIAPVEESDPAEQLDFYDMLETFEVHVPEEGRNRRADPPSAPISKPGLYVIQAGSSRNRANAELERDRLIKQGIDATIQKVTIDENEWHRVIVGPSRDLAYINSTREALRTAQVTFRIYALGE